MGRLQQDTLPGPLIRLARNGTLVAAVVVLGGLSAATGATAESAQVRLDGAVDAQWRGAYDLLVRPAGARLSLEHTQGLVEPNFLGFAGRGGITIEQVNAIRGLRDVEVAAPVSIVGNVSYTPSAPSICTTVLPAAPSLYALNLRASTTDGVQEITVYHSRGEVLLGPLGPGMSNFPSMASNMGPMSAAQGPGLDIVTATLPSLPAIVSPLMAVDPEAERALLGPTAAFLNPLIDLAGEGRASLTVDRFDLSAIPQEFETARLMFHGISDAARDRPLVPLVVSERLYAPLKLELTIDQIGNQLKEYPEGDGEGQRLLAAAAAAGSGRSRIGFVSRDISTELRPFIPPSLVSYWPGSGRPIDCETLELRTPMLQNVELPGRPVYEERAARRGDSQITVSISPVRPVDPSGRRIASVPPSAPPEGSVIGIEQSYRDIVTVPLAIAKGYSPRDTYDQPFFFAPVGGFDLSTLADTQSPLAYVPLGAYSPPDTDLIAGPDGSELATPIAMSSTLNPVGLIEVPPLAITDIQAARILRGEAPIDAVRVRVAGLTGYDAVGRARVETVASAVAALGLDVDIVAGSSPQEISIYVPSYRPAVDPPTDLGYVRQGWTTLGAAERVETGLGSINLVLLVMALFVSIVFTVGIQLTTLATRTRDVSILRAVGWDAVGTARWLLAESVVAGGLVFLIGLAAWLVAGKSIAGIIATTAIAVALPLGGTLATALAWSRSAPGAPARGDIIGERYLRQLFRVGGPVGLAARNVLARPIRSLVLIVALATGAATLALGVGLTLEALQRVGPTRLAAELAGTLRPYQLVILGLSCAASISLTAVLLRLDLVARRAEMDVLVATGWDRRDLRLTMLAQRTFLALPSVLLAATLVAVAAQPFGVGMQFTMVVSMVAASSIVVWGVLASPRRAGSAGI